MENYKQALPTKFWESFGLMLIHPSILLTWRLALSWIYEICGFTSSRIRDLESPEVWSRGFMIRCILDTTEAFRTAAVVKSVYETRGSIIKLIHLKKIVIYSNKLTITIRPIYIIRSIYGTKISNKSIKLNFTFILAYYRGSVMKKFT